MAGPFERYMHYPVNREQAEQPTVERAAASASVSPATPVEALRPPPDALAPAAAPIVAEAVVEE